MNTSLFLAKALGLYFIITGIFTFVRYKYIEDVVKSLNRERGVIFVFAIITLMLGILMVVAHNVWVADWRIIITLLAWFTLIVGIFRLFFQETMLKMGDWWLHHKEYLLILTGIFFLIGCYLLYKGIHWGKYF